MSQARAMLGKQIDDIKHALKHSETDPVFAPLLGLMESNLQKIVDQWDKEFVEEYEGYPLLPGYVPAAHPSEDDYFEDILRGI